MEEEQRDKIMPRKAENILKSLKDPLASGMGMSERRGVSKPKAPITEESPFLLNQAISTIR